MSGDACVVWGCPRVFRTWSRFNTKLLVQGMFPHALFAAILADLRIGPTLDEWYAHVGSMLVEPWNAYLTNFNLRQFFFQTKCCAFFLPPPPTFFFFFSSE